MAAVALFCVTSLAPRQVWSQDETSEEETVDISSFIDSVPELISEIDVVQSMIPKYVKTFQFFELSHTDLKARLKKDREEFAEIKELSGQGEDEKVKERAGEYGDRYSDKLDALKEALSGIKTLHELFGTVSDKDTRVLLKKGVSMIKEPFAAGLYEHVDDLLGTILKDFKKNKRLYTAKKPSKEVKKKIQKAFRALEGRMQEMIEEATQNDPEDDVTEHVFNGERSQADQQQSVGVKPVEQEKPMKKNVELIQKIDALKKIEIPKIEPLKVNVPSLNDTTKQFNDAMQRSIQWDAMSKTLNLGTGL